MPIPNIGTAKNAIIGRAMMMSMKLWGVYKFTSLPLWWWKTLLLFPPSAPVASFSITKHAHLEKLWSNNDKYKTVKIFMSDFQRQRSYLDIFGQSLPSTDVSVHTWWRLSSLCCSPTLASSISNWVKHTTKQIELYIDNVKWAAMGWMEGEQ